MRFARPIAALVALGATACGSAEPRSAPPGAADATGAVAPSSAASGGAWSTRRLSFDAPPEQMAQVVDVVDTGNELLAVGLDADGLAVWSADGEAAEFRRVHSYGRLPAHHLLDRAEIAIAGTRVVVVASERESATDTETAFTIQSSDGGLSWSEPVRYAGIAWVEDLTPTDHGFLASLVSYVAEHRAELTPAWTHDLQSWTPLGLPTVPGSAVGWVVDGPDVWVSGALDDGSGATWHSGDGGQTFGEPLSTGGALLDTAIGGRAVYLPESHQDLYVESPPAGLTLIAPDGTREESAPDTGQWGDGGVEVHAQARGPGGRLWAVVSRMRLANVHYCYDPGNDCWQRETVLVTTTDGIGWHDAEGPPLETGWQSLVGVGYRADGSLRLWSHTREQDVAPKLTLHEWTGPGAPPLVDPPGYPAPDRSLPLLDPIAPMPVGTIARYALGLGGCGGMYIEQTRWIPEAALPDPPPAGWPYEPIEIADGPTGYVFGTVTRVDETTIDFSLNGVGTVATFHPRFEEPEYRCG